MANTFCHFLLRRLPHRTWQKLRSAYDSTFAKINLLRRAPCAMHDVFVRYIRCGNPASETYSCPSWSLRLLLLALQLFVSFVQLYISLPCYSIHSQLTSVVNHSSRIPLTSSSHLNLGLPILLTAIGLHSFIPFTIVYLSILTILGFYYA